MAASSPAKRGTRVIDTRYDRACWVPQPAPPAERQNPDRALAKS